MEIKYKWIALGIQVNSCERVEGNILPFFCFFCFFLLNFFTLNIILFLMANLNHEAPSNFFSNSGVKIRYQTQVGP